MKRLIRSSLAISMLLFVSSMAALGQGKDFLFSGDPTKPIFKLGEASEPSVSSLKNGADSGPAADATPHETPYCLKKEDGAFTSDIEMAQGETDDFYWAQGGGCIFRPLRESWAVLQNQSLMIWDGVDRSTYELRADRPPKVTHAYVIQYVVNGLFDVTWWMEWYHSVSKGTTERPRQVIINYQKVRGTKFIPYWRGSIVLDYVSPNITSFAMRNEVDAMRQNPTKTANTIRTILKRVQTGKPNWHALRK